MKKIISVKINAKITNNELNIYYRRYTYCVLLLDAIHKYLNQFKTFRKYPNQRYLKKNGAQTKFRIGLCHVALMNEMTVQCVDHFPLLGAHISLTGDAQTIDVWIWHMVSFQSANKNFYKNECLFHINFDLTKTSDLLGLYMVKHIHNSLVNLKKMA